MYFRASATATFPGVASAPSLEEVGTRVGATVGRFLDGVFSPSSEEPVAISPPAIITASREGFRLERAKLLYERGFGKFFSSFEDFCADIPQPEGFCNDSEGRPRNLVLVYGGMKLRPTLELLGIATDPEDNLGPVGHVSPNEVVYWITVGAKKIGRGVSLSPREVGLKAKEGAMALLQNALPRAECLLLPGSYWIGDKKVSAFIRTKGGTSELRCEWRWAPPKSCYIAYKTI